MEFDSVHDLAQHLFNSKELILNMAKEREALQAEVERLRKAGDWMYNAVILNSDMEMDKAMDAWNAAKEGKPQS